MIVTHHREKLINAIIYFAKHTKFCGKTKLLKLLYFLDFSHFKQTGKSVTGLDYFAWEMGPVPKDLFEELTVNMMTDMRASIHDLSTGEDFQQIRPKKKFDSQYFSKKEIKLLKDLAFIFKDAKADTMVESTHLKNQPWDRTLKEKGEFKKIDYMLAIDSDIVSIPYDEAKERLEERSEMHKIFGVGWLQTRGTIFHHRQLVFHNGFTGKKYLILLNTPGKEEPYLFIKTTSQKKDKPTTTGCIKELSLFFIPAGRTFFLKDTWVQLYDIYEFSPKDIDTNKDITIEGSIDVKMIDDIVNCLFEAEEDNIAAIHKNLLRPQLQDSLLKLKTKFNKRK